MGGCAQKSLWKFKKAKSKKTLQQTYFDNKEFQDVGMDAQCKQLLNAICRAREADRSELHSPKL